MIEREVRYRINEKIKEEIINHSALIKKATNYVDLCMGRHGFDSLDKLGYIIRLRENPEKCVMEAKKRLDGNTWRESQIKICSMKQGYDFLKNIGLEPYLYINRTREVRQINVAKIYIDELELLGSFVEFELEDGYDFRDLEEYLKKFGIENKPEKLYGDIFKDKVRDPSFNKELNKAINKFLNKNEQ